MGQEPPAYEALARAHAVAGDARHARHHTGRALAAAKDIAEDEERAILLAGLEPFPASRATGRRPLGRRYRAGAGS